MAELNIVRVNALPAVLEANTLYMVKGAAGDLFDIYVVGEEVTSVRHLATKDEITASVILFGDEPPQLPNPVKLWWNTVEGTLYIQYNDGTNTYWVESIASIVVPDFAGTGNANSMARSDHNHDEKYVAVGAHEW